MRAALLCALLLVPSAARADPSALWKIVSGQCVPHEQQARDPAPCSAVDISNGTDKGYALLKDQVGIGQFLLIPTTRISGIEDPAIRAPDATNYWDAAWRDRYFLEERLHSTLPRDAIALAVNSAFGRSQDQLHIHIDCIRADVHALLVQNLEQIGTGWTTQPLLGHRYRAMRIAQETPEGINPFQVLADSDPSAAADMAMHTLVLAGAVFADGSNGFVLLDDRAGLLSLDRASGEELQDHSCAIARK